MNTVKIWRDSVMLLQTVSLLNTVLSQIQDLINVSQSLSGKNKRLCTWAVWKLWLESRGQYWHVYGCFHPLTILQRVVRWELRGGTLRCVTALGVPQWPRSSCHPKDCNNNLQQVLFLVQHTATVKWQHKTMCCSLEMLLAGGIWGTLHCWAD